MEASGNPVAEEGRSLLSPPEVEDLSRPLLQLEGVWKVYGRGRGRVEAVKGVSLSVQEGDFLAVMGPSGSGKSTLLHLMGLLQRPTSGRVLFGGRDVSYLSDAALSALRNTEIGFVFQAFHLLPRAPALASVELPLLYRGLPARERRKLALAALARVGLADRAHHRPSELSGGEQQRVAVARALAGSPRLILADEPTGNLDSASGREIISLLSRLNQELGVAVVVVTHDPEVAGAARKTLWMRDGVLVGEAELTSAPSAPSRQPSFRRTHLAGRGGRLRLRDLLRQGLGSLGRNRLRAGLTALGVVIGVAAVVLLVAVGAGVRSEVTRGIQSLGSDLIVAFPGSLEVSGGHPVSPLTSVDVSRIQERLGERARVAGSVASSARVSAGGRRVFATVDGTTAGFHEVVERPLAAGRWYTRGEVEAGARVAVLGSKVTRSLFSDSSPLGRTVTVAGVSFRVVGTLVPVGSAGIGFDRDNMVFVPITALQAVAGRTTLDAIFVKAPSASEVPRYKALVEEYLARTYPGDEFSVLGQDQILDLAGRLLAVVTIALSAIAAISLVVGGIGIMNVTLVSVAERTREIGVRRAVGARATDVLWQFLLEAVLTSVAGGTVGLLIAVTGAYLLARLSPVPAEVTPWAVALSLGLALGVGVFFGVWPARRAARLDPVEALGRE